MHSKLHIRFLLVVVLAMLAAGTGCNRLKARDKLNKGVNAYKNGAFDAAIEDFKQAKELDPKLANARLYLATAYASLYTPGAPAPENIRNGEQAIKEYQEVLDDDPNSLPAIDGIGSILFNMAGNPFDPKRMEESKTYHKRHISISPNDPEPYYWIGVIDWTLAFRGNTDMRSDYNKTVKKTIRGDDPMPPKLSAQFAEKYGGVVDEGIDLLQKGMTLRPDYSDAMAYLNLLYRQKSDMETSPEARDHDIDLANDLVDKVKAIKQRASGG
jgi:tetratricopeptide (TPR) repeat protein